MSNTAESAAEVIEGMTAGWEVRQIREVADVNPRIDKKAIPDNLEVSFVPMPAVQARSGQIDVSGVKLAKQVKKGFTVFLEGDVLFAKITPCMENGKMAIVPALVNNYGFGSTEFHVLRAGKEIDAKYLYYYVSSKSFRGEAERFMTGAVGQKRVSTTYIKEATIPVAPLEDQRRIVAEIEKSRLDEAVASLKRVKANLKRYKAAVLKAAVEGKLTEEWRKQNPDVEPASKLLERILAERRTKWEESELAKMRAKGKEPKNDKWKEKYIEPSVSRSAEGAVIPSKWVLASVGQLAAVGTGATPLKSNAAYYDGGTIPWVTSGALNDDFVRNTEDFITLLALDETNVKLFPVHSLLVAMYGEGKTRGKVSELLIEATTNQACAALVFDGLAKELKGYVKIFFQKNYDDIRRLSSGGVQPNLNLGIVKETALPLPPFAEQSKIFHLVEQKMSVISEIESRLMADIARANRLRQSVLAVAFSGSLTGQNRFSKLGD